ncbi:lipopolysaccharide biosynthesis protein [Vibrio cholerae]|uniref:lipopolysaccharide biosynthesis protein n=1 Tax=Vibrio cholerae TaxID=666 RepID=UPI0011DB6070|nr:oligosaccharide flippase family protein [Vibrio cholerae]TYA77448.1 oligosaccharide flippase family protein [Vibrio cholerae]BCN20584.1 putative O-antigen flippase [Vibrio cholerae]GIB49327.1 lipopolysaccharide biosynthesis protein [Vibrio cholerae]
MKNIKSNERLASACYLLGSVLNAAIGFFFIPIFMSKLSVSDYGVFSILQLCGTIFSAVFYLGITSAFTRSYFDYQIENEKRKCLSTAFILINTGALIQIILGYILSEYLSKILFNNESYDILVTAAISSASFVFLNFFFLTYFRLSNKPKIFLGLSVFSALLNIILTCISLVIMDKGINGIIYSSLISQFILYVILFRVVFSDFKVFLFDSKQAKVMLHYGFQIVLSSAAGLSIIWSDQFFINHFLNLDDVGVYSLSVKLAGVMTFVFVTPFFQVVNPIILDSLKNKDTKKLCQYYYDKYLYLGLISILSTYYIAYVYFLFFRGSEYVAALKYLPWLLLSLFFHGSINILSLGFSITRNMKPQSKVYIVMALMNIILNSLFIPSLGINGAVLSTILSYSILSILLYKLSNNLYNIEFSHYGLIPCSTIFAMFISLVYSAENKYVTCLLLISIITIFSLWTIKLKASKFRI